MSWTSRMGIAQTDPQIDFLHLRAGADVLGRSAFQHLAEMQHRDLVGDVEHDIHVMLDQQDRQVCDRALGEIRHFRRLAGRQAGGRLVEQQDVRIAGKPDHDLELALLAMRQVAHFNVLAVEEGGAFQEPMRLVVDLAIGRQEPPHHEFRREPAFDRQQHVVEHRQLRKQARDLKRARHAERGAAVARPAR